MQRSVIEAAAPTTADAWTDIDTIKVPANVNYLRGVNFGYSPKIALTGGTQASIRALLGARVMGSGLQEQNPHQYLICGMGFVYGSVATNYNQAMMAVQNVIQSYDVSIPVSVGAEIDIQSILLDEVGFAGDISVELLFSEEGEGDKNQMSDFIDSVGTTTADVYSEIGELTIPNPDRPPEKIREVIIATACDMGTSGVELQVSPIIRLTGAGLKSGGDHEFLGGFGYFNNTEKGGTGINGGAQMIQSFRRIPCDIPINSGGIITVEHKFATETPTASTIAVGVLYE